MKQQLSNEGNIDALAHQACATFKIVQKLEEMCEESVEDYLHAVVNQVKNLNERDVCASLSLCKKRRANY